MPCNEEPASLHFSETDFTVGDKTTLERSAVPNPFTVASHSISAQHHGGPISNFSSLKNAFMSWSLQKRIPRNPKP
jgi:hypothetical protein